jgi:hypothetical protein
MGQDWGGRRRMNPEGCPKVTAEDVLAKAAVMGVEVKRGGWFKSTGSFYHSAYGTWWIKEDVWRQIGGTNFLALQYLERITNEQR